MIRALNPLEYIRARRARQMTAEIDLLFGAAIIGDDAAIIRLLKQGLDVNYQDSKGESALHWAAQHGSTSVVQLLLEEGASPNICDKRNATPVHYAADQGHVEVLNLLLNHGGKVNQKDRGGSAPLHWAVSSGKKESVELLLDKGAEIDSEDNGGVTALQLAAYYGRLHIASLLIRRGASVNPVEDKDGPLHSAAEMGHLNITQLLISKGADVNKQDKSGFTALHLAAKRGHREVVRCLLEHGSDRDLKNEHGQTPVESASTPEMKHLIRSSVSDLAPRSSSADLSKHHRSASGPSPALSKSLDDPKKMSGQLKLISFLKDLQLDQYIPKFLEEEFDFETLGQVTEDDLVQMGVKIGSRRKLLAALQRTPSLGGHAGGGSSNSISREKSWAIEYGELQLLFEAGQGYYGCVYKGMWNNAEVAVKKIFPSKIQNLEKWLMEVEFLSTLRHPNIVVFYGACTTGPHLCIVTEWISKGSLHAVLASLSHPLDRFKILSFATDIARGLAFLHMHDPPVIHRDLKSENLLVTNNWRIKLTDFGLSRFKDSSYNYTHPQHPFDVTIAAPEVLDQNHLSEKADIYSFALILWQLHTRQKPFEGKNPHWVAKSVLNDRTRPVIPEGIIPEPMQQLITLCWEHDYQKRPTAKQIIARLEEMHRIEAAKPAVLPEDDSPYKKKLSDSSDSTDGGSTMTGSFVELGKAKKDANNYVLEEDE